MILNNIKMIEDEILKNFPEVNLHCYNNPVLNCIIGYSQITIDKIEPMIKVTVSDHEGYHHSFHTMESLRRHLKSIKNEILRVQDEVSKKDPNDPSRNYPMIKSIMKVKVNK